MSKQIMLLAGVFVLSVAMFVFIKMESKPSIDSSENPGQVIDQSPEDFSTVAPEPDEVQDEYSGEEENEEDDTDYSYLDAMSGDAMSGDADGQEDLFPEDVNSMEYAREHGDPRTPPIVRSEREMERATEEELQDEELYQDYELRQQQKVYKSFIEESQKKISYLKEMLEKGQAEGLPEEQLTEARKKITGLEEMREKLIQENPGLVEGD